MKGLTKEIEDDIKLVINNFDFDKIIAYKKISNIENNLDKDFLKTIAFSLLYDCVKSKIGFCICESNNLIALKNIVKGKTQLVLRYYIEESNNI